MVNYNSININKTNNLLSFQIIEPKKDHNIMMLEIQILAWDMLKTVVRLNQLMGSHPSSLDNGNSNGNIDINKQKFCTELLTFDRDSCRIKF